MILNFLVIPYGLPILPVETMKTYGMHMRDNYGLSSPLRWEDDSVHDLGQDYSDMHGWEEMVRYAGNYGQAGALTFYRHKYNLPEPMSWNASYLLWVPELVSFDRQIAIEDSPDTHWPNARGINYIYYLTEPTEDVEAVWLRIARAQKVERLGEE